MPEMKISDKNLADARAATIDPGAMTTPDGMPVTTANPAFSGLSVKNNVSDAAAVAVGGPHRQQG